MNLLGNAIARSLNSASGIIAVYLPEGIKREIVESIVSKANSLRLESPPYAILVRVGKDDLSRSECPIVSPTTAIMYRQDERLAVCYGKHPDIKSFVGVYRKVLDQDYPGGTSSSLPLQTLADSSLDEVLSESGIQIPKVWDRSVAVARIAKCFEQLGEAHESLSQGSSSWNVYWFEHISLGLNRLAQALRDFAVSNPSGSLDEALQALTYASFSLPTPHHGLGLSPSGSVGKSIVDALGDWWSDSQAILATVNALATHIDTVGSAHPLSKIDWATFGETLAAEDNLLMAFARHSLDDPKSVSLFQSLTENQFFNPLGVQENNCLLELHSVDGKSLTLGDSRGPFLVMAESTDESKGDIRVVSQEVLISIPLLDPDSQVPLSESQIAESLVTLIASDSSIAWDGLPELTDGQVLARGRVSRWVGSAPFLWDVRPFTLSLTVPAGDVLEGIVANKATATILIAPADGTGVSLFRLNSGALAHVASLGPLEFDANGMACGAASKESSTESLEIDRGRDYRLVVWRTKSLKLNGSTGSELPDRDGIWQIDFQSADLHEMVADNLVVEFSVLQPASACLSPLVAALRKCSISTDEADISTTQSLRGHIEQLLSENSLTETWQEALGHVVLPVDRSEDLSTIAMIDGRGFLGPAGYAAEWSNAYVNFRVPEEVMYSEQANEFRTSFSKIQARLPMVRNLDGTDFAVWPSRVSWRFLWEDKQLLANYLNSFSALVEFAKSTSNPAAIFWASYPFSLSVWSSSGDGCTAVLMSPLHPLRLAWLSTTEWAFYNSQESTQLGGTVEAWNLPILGPRNSNAGRMLAVPLENGEDQLFLGWSMLVKASIDDPSPLELPIDVAGYPSPGASSSGLNASSVEASVRDYRKVNPHVSTLTVDLAATNKVRRLKEVDDAVLAATGLWGKPSTMATSGLIGGIRVRDSLFRRGDSPRDEIASLLAKQPGVPISWSRYQPNQRTENCNLRLLQDAGIRVSVASEGGTNQGVIGPLPLRRFDSAPPKIVAGSSNTSPALTPGQGWEPFVHALRQVEGADGQPVISSQLHRALLVDSRADWTVSGETLMSPSAMAKLLGEGGVSGQMLWEWRPPFLETSKSSSEVPLLERRPYVSVVRVPGGFKAQLKEMLSRVLSEESTDEQVAELLNLLGSRGVGLSSLTAMGGTHTAGAIGFYLAMRMMDSVNVDGVDQIVVPIDACDAFLRALGGGVSHGDLRQRADLMVIRILEESVIFCPIEIKLYGLLAAEPPEILPTINANRLDKSAEQLLATRSVLQSVEKNSLRWVADPECGDARLWTNALLTLIDSGIRLRNPDVVGSSGFGDRLRNVAEGKSRVVVGRPVLCFFGHGAQTHEGEYFSKYIDMVRDGSKDLGPMGALISNPGEIHRQLNGAGGSALEAWRDVIEWACLPQEEQFLNKAKAEKNISGSRSTSEQPCVPGSESTGDGSTSPAEQPEKLPERGDADRSAAVPVELSESGDGPRRDGMKFEVGNFLDTVGQSSAEFWPSNTALNQMNVGVVGDLGTGKTQLLKSLMFNLRASSKSAQHSPVSVLVFDYKKDYQDPEFLNAVGGKVLRPERIPLNVFALSADYSPLLAYQKAQSFIDVLTKIYGGIGPVQRDNLATAITGLFAEQKGKPPTLSQVLSKYREISGGSDAVVSVLNPFVIGEVFSDDPDSLESFESLLNDNVLVVSLSDLGTDQRMKNALVVLFLNQYYDFMLRQKKWNFVTNEDGVQLRTLNSFLLVDEATNIMQYEFQVLMNLMLQGREFGTGVILASQYLSHFKAGQSNYGQPLLTWFIHKVPSVTKQQLLTLGITSASDDMAAMIPKLEPHQALYRSLGIPGKFVRGEPFYELAARRNLSR
jgi:hypothetical protein